MPPGERSRGDLPTRMGRRPCEGSRAAGGCWVLCAGFDKGGRGRSSREKARNSHLRELSPVDGPIKRLSDSLQGGKISFPLFEGTKLVALVAAFLGN